MAVYPYYNPPYFGGQSPYMGNMGMVPNPPAVPQYQPQYPAQGQPSQAMPQTMTPPTIHAEIIQARSIEDVERFPVNAGTKQLFQLADDSAFVMKCVLANGETALDIYDKRPKKPAAVPPDLSLYVTREELERRLEGLIIPRKRVEKQEPEPEQTSM